MSDEIGNEQPVKKKRVRKKAKPSGIKGKRPSGLPTGRPTLYCDALKDRICEIVATHIEPMGALCEKFDELPNEYTIRLWRFRYPEFNAAFNIAKTQQAELFAESIDQESQNIHTYIDKEGNVRYDSAHVAAKKLLTDNRRWLATTLAPKIYQRTQQIEIKSDSAEKDAEIKKLKEKLEYQFKKDF